MSTNSTILIVDDEAVGRETMAESLMVEDYHLAFASNGPETLVKAAELVPDVILLDVMMPDMDGFEVCQRLRADPFLAEVPIILVTALDDHDSLLQGIEAGADDFISKPFNRAELRARVRTITRLNRYRQLLVERTKFELVVTQTTDGYLLVDGEDNVLYANPRACLYLGLPADTGESITEPFLSLASEQYHPQPQEAWANWPVRTSKPSITRYLVRPESSTARAFWLQVEILKLPVGPDMGQIVHLQDVTAQMALQRDMRSFHNQVAHKLRTPLASVLPSMDLLADSVAEISSAKIDKLVKTASRGVLRLYREIESILQYSQTLHLAQPDISFNLAQLQPVVTEISTELGLEAISISDQEGLAETQVVFSQRTVELMLWEILENAKKFHPHQSPTMEIFVSRSDSGDVRLQVCDDGLTLSPEQLAQVWTPYYQGEKYFSGETPGMGLGLSMVASLMWNVGGTCRLYNRKEGPGVVVELILPLVRS